VRAYLAVQAILADMPASTAMPTVKSRRDALGDYLARGCFQEVARAGRQPTVYDSPTHLTPGILIEKTTMLQEALQAAKSASGAAQP
jgi:hypothetical protein